MDIDIENLIKVIEQHSILYDTSTKEYYDRTKKKQLWEFVCFKLNPNWSTFTEHEKTLYGKEVQKKWQSLRDCFRRELTIQKNAQTSTGKKKAKYKYFDHLQFLIPFTQNMPVENQDGGGVEIEFEKDPLTTEPEPKRKRKYSFSEEECSQKTYESSKKYFDDDEAFLMSLLPSFKEYSLDQKYCLRIELMKTILQFKQSQSVQRNLYSVQKFEVNEEEYS